MPPSDESSENNGKYGWRGAGGYGPAAFTDGCVAFAIAAGSGGFPDPQGAPPWRALGASEVTFGFAESIFADDDLMDFRAARVR